LIRRCISIELFDVTVQNVAAVYTQLLATSQTNPQLFPSFPLKRAATQLKNAAVDALPKS